jgi:hypothetical protein
VSDIEREVLDTEQAQMIQERDERLQALYNTLYDFINNETFWNDNCIFCFLVFKLGRDVGEMDMDHSSASCTSTLVARYSSCSTCFGINSHPGSIYCQQKIIPAVEGLCYHCWLPMKVGPHWLHKDPASFGRSDCSIPQWTGRLLYMLSRRVLNNFKVEKCESKQEYADWLASTSMDPASYGVFNSVLALIFILDLADNELKKQI